MEGFYLSWKSNILTSSFFLLVSSKVSSSTKRPTRVLAKLKALESKAVKAKGRDRGKAPGDQGGEETIGFGSKTTSDIHNWLSATSSVMSANGDDDFDEVAQVGSGSVWSQRENVLEEWPKSLKEAKERLVGSKSVKVKDRVLFLGEVMSFVKHTPGMLYVCIGTEAHWRLIDSGNLE